MRGRAASIALAIALASEPGCGVPQQMARGVAEAAIGSLARKVGDRENFLDLKESMTRRGAGALVGELGRPERLREVQRIAAAKSAGVVSGALKAAGPLGAGLSAPVEAIAEQAARAFARQLAAQLGPAGEGPLATSVSATAEQMGRAGSAGVVAGLRASLGIWPLLLAFGGGTLSTLALAWAWAVYRDRRRPAP